MRLCLLGQYTDKVNFYWLFTGFQNSLFSFFFFSYKILSKCQLAVPVPLYFIYHAILKVFKALFL